MSAQKHGVRDALRHRDFRRYAIGRFCATLAWQMLGVAVGWQVYRLTGDPLALGLIGLWQFLPFVSLVLIGGQAADIVLLILNAKGMASLLESQFTLGVDAAVAAGPKGRTTEAATDVQMKAEMTHDGGKRGPQDWDRVVKLIAAGGYKGYLSLEYEAKEPAATAVPRGLAELRTLCRKYSA